MKKITLIRHAKSSWKHNVSDRERPLKSRGYNDAALISEALKENNFTSEAYFSSPAQRALTTAELILSDLGIDVSTIEIREELYDFNGDQVIRFIKALPESLNSIVVFGHNNALTNISNTFGNMVIDNLPTCGVIILSFKSETWNSIQRGTTEFFMTPKQLKNE